MMHRTAAEIGRQVIRLEHILQACRRRPYEPHRAFDPPLPRIRRRRGLGDHDRMRDGHNELCAPAAREIQLIQRPPSEDSRAK